MMVGLSNQSKTERRRRIGAAPLRHKPTSHFKGEMGSRGGHLSCYCTFCFALHTVSGGASSFEPPKPRDANPQIPLNGGSRGFVQAADFQLPAMSCRVIQHPCRILTLYLVP